MTDRLDRKSEEEAHFKKDSYGQGSKCEGEHRRK